MFRKSAVAAAMLLVSVAPRVFALGLGDIEMRSALNQPMDAVIELTSAAGADLDDIRVSLASLQEHARAGLTKHPLLANFRFEVVKNPAGRVVIRVSSNELVREPYLEFLLELDWPRGRLLRQYTVLVDPPVTMPAAPAKPAVPRTRPAATPAPASPAPVARSPVRHTAPATVSVAPPPAADSYGPIRRSETLWQIAERVRPGTDISMDQMMLALLRANPEAFASNNINRLKAGVTLSIPGRDEILSVSAREARAETRRQYSQWKAEQGRPPVAAATAGPVEAQAQLEEAAPAVAGESGARLQLMAPESDAVSSAAVQGDPASTESAPGSEAIQQQLALAAEEVAAGRAQSAELQSRVSELEEQIRTMKRLLELKDDELASLQQSVGAEEQATEQAATAEADAAAADETPESTKEAAAQAAGETDLSGQPAGLVDRLMDNPLLAGLGVLVAMLLGGFLWASSRSKGGQGILDDELTMERQLAAAAGRETARPVPEVPVRETEMADDEPGQPLDPDLESDPLTEADVYLAYGRIQQAEDVLLAALQSNPDNPDARLKLLEVYHTGGNATAFDQAAKVFHDMVGDSDSRWQHVAEMGLKLSPHNALYGGGAPAADDGAEFDMDLSGLEEINPQPEVAGTAEREDAHTIEFTLDTADNDEEDDGEGLLDNEDEVTTKLDLARAYIDMDDKESARSILGEVIEEGNVEQKEEAESIISRLA